MGLGKYRPYKDEFHDEGYEKSNSTCRFCTGFYNRNTIQVWDVSSVASVECVNGRSYFRRQKLA
jgi:hypothetical protein